MKSALHTNEQIGKAKAKAIKPFSQMSVKFFMAILALIVVVGGFKAMTSVVALATNFATTVRRFMSASHAHTHTAHKSISSSSSTAAAVCRIFGWQR